MNRFAIRTTSIAIDMLKGLLKMNIKLKGAGNIPDGSVIYVFNHFFRWETFVAAHLIWKETKKNIWTLADHSLFIGSFGKYLNSLGAVSTKDPDRDRLIVKTLLTGEAQWIIFPEGRMVKDKKVYEKGEYVVSSARGMHPPRTGAASLALRAEFYRQRIKYLADILPAESNRLLDRFGLKSFKDISGRGVSIVPVNISYYPIRARENFLNTIAEKFVGEVPERITEELMNEGNIIFSHGNVSMCVRFGKPIKVKELINDSEKIGRDIRMLREFDFDDPIPSKEAMIKIARTTTNQYMKTIYCLTEVNHDNIFASMLRHYPFKRIMEIDFRRRAFLIIEGDIKKTEVHVHDRLNDSQVDLLVDKNYQALEDFLILAKEKGILKRMGGFLYINREKLNEDYNFHTVRLTNPIEVMANAVEPLTRLQRYIWRYSVLPRFLLKEKVVDLLIKKAEDTYAADYNKYYSPGETKDISVGHPRLLVGFRNRKRGVLLVHGYMAAPPEVMELADYLNKKGLWVYVPRLKGHGTSPDDLAGRTCEDWIESVEEGYAIISNLCREVIVGGFSTGAGLGIELATRNKRIKGIFGVAPPGRLMNFFSHLVPALNTWNIAINKAKLDSLKKEFVNNDPENPHINYFRNPISGVRELEKLMKALGPKLKDIKIPALIIQSNRDPVVNPAGTRAMYEKLGSSKKEYLMVDSDRHGILSGVGSKRVHKAIWEFIKHIK